MILKNLLKSAFKDVVKAQYEAYLYSLELKREQDEDELFPIPTVKVSDLTFQLQYAYTDDLKESTIKTVDKKKFLMDVKRATLSIVKEGINQLISYVDTNKTDELEEWDKIKKGLTEKELPNYVTKTIFSALKENYSTLVNDENEFNEKYYQTTVTNNFDLYVIDHFDLAPLQLSPGDKQWLSYSIQPISIEKSKLLGKQIINRRIEKEVQDTTIIVDSKILKTLPRKAIQHMTLNVKLDDLEEIKID